MKLELPKNSWLINAEVRFHQRGFYNGYPELALEFSSKGAHPSTDTILEILSQLIKVKLPRLNLVWVHGSFLPQDDKLYSLLHSLKDYGFYIGAASMSQIGVQLWYDKVDFLQMWTPGPLVPFLPQEIVYTPASFPAPNLQYPLDPQKVVWLRLNTTQARPTQEEVFEFMAQAHGTWSLY